MASDSVPAAAKQWTVKGTDGVDSLVLTEASIPKVGDNQVLVKSTPGTPPALKGRPLTKGNSPRCIVERT